MKNFMIFLFSRQARLNMSYIFIAMNIFQIVAGCTMTGGSIYICLSITKYLYAEKAEIKFVFTVFGIFGTHIIIHYLVGIKIVERCFVKAHKRSTKRILQLWLILCAITIGYLLILATMIVKISKHIIRSIRHSMEKGMRHYLNDPVWKHTMDRWQFSLQCCGVNNFQDWYGVSWLDKYHVNVDSATIQSLLLSRDHLHLPVVPWSCCNIGFPMQCFHDPIQQIRSVHVWKEQPELPELSLNKVGCLEAIRYPIEMALVAFLIICILLILVQIAITIVSRFLYTSCRNAVIMHRTAGSAPGWLFGRDCLADRRGRTLSEVMLDLETKQESEYEDDNEYDDEEETEDESRAMLKRASPRAKPPLKSPNTSKTSPSKLQSSALSAQPVTPNTASNPSTLKQPPFSKSSNPSSQKPLTLSKTSNPSSQKPLTLSRTSNPSSQKPLTLSKTSNPSSLKPLTLSKTSNPSSLKPLPSKSSAGKQLPSLATMSSTPRVPQRSTSPKPPKITPRRDSLQSFPKRSQEKRDLHTSKEKKSNVIAGYTYQSSDHNPTAFQEGSPISSRKKNQPYYDSQESKSLSISNVGSSLQNLRETLKNMKPLFPMTESKFESLHKHYSPMNTRIMTLEQSPESGYKERHKRGTQMDADVHVNAFDYVPSTTSHYYSDHQSNIPIMYDRNSQEFGSFQKYEESGDNRNYSRPGTSQDAKRQSGQKQTSIFDDTVYRLTPIKEAEPSLPEKDYDDEESTTEIQWQSSRRYYDDGKQGHNRYNDSARNPVSDHTENVLMLR